MPLTTKVFDEGGEIITPTVNVKEKPRGPNRRGTVEICHRGVLGRIVYQIRDEYIYIESQDNFSSCKGVGSALAEYVFRESIRQGKGGRLVNSASWSSHVFHYKWGMRSKFDNQNKRIEEAILKERETGERQNTSNFGAFEMRLPPETIKKKIAEYNIDINNPMPEGIEEDKYAKLISSITDDNLKDSKNKFLMYLQYDLKEMNRGEILDLFNELKKTNGKYSFIHKQRNSLWDSFRLFFKSERNDETNPWLTATYRKAVKLLIDAYISKKDDLSAQGRQGEADALLDCVTDNSPISSKRA